MKICIILNGEIKNYDYINSVVVTGSYDYIICSDGGANHAYSMNIVPDYIIGDLDSVNENIIEYYKSKKVKFEKFPTKKDETDTELCIELSDKLKAKEIHLIGALGGRIDHTIANINLLYYIRKRGITPKIISEKEEIYIAMDEEITKINENKFYKIRMSANYKTGFWEVTIYTTQGLSVPASMLPSIMTSKMSSKDKRQK